MSAIVISVALEMKASFKKAYLFTSDTHMKKVVRQKCAQKTLTQPGDGI